MKLHVISAVTGVAGVPERICSIIQARPCLLRSQALLDLIIQLSAEYHPVPDDVIAQDTEQLEVTKWIGIFNSIFHVSLNKPSYEDNLQ